MDTPRQLTDRELSFIAEIDSGKLIGELIIQIAMMRAQLGVIIEQQARIAKRVGLSETNFREGTLQGLKDGWPMYLAQIQERLVAAKLAPNEPTDEAVGTVK